MVKVTKTIVKNGVAKSYSMLCDETQLESLLTDSRFTLEPMVEEQKESKEETLENDFSPNKKKRK